MRSRNLLLTGLAVTLAGPRALGQPAPGAVPYEARLSFQGPVEVADPPAAPAGAVHRRPATQGMALQRGLRLWVPDGASAELSFRDGTRWVLAPGTAMVLFGSATPPPPGLPPTTHSTLQRGVVRLLPARDEAHADGVPLGTLSSTVLSGRGEAVVRADLAGRSTRVAVYRGRVRVRGATQEFIVRAGSAMVLPAGAPPGLVHPLAAPPAWRTTPAETLVSVGDPVSVAVAWAPAPRTARISQWHVQVARDEAFTDLVMDALQAARVNRLELPGLGAGAFHLRVSAVDADRLEGVYGPVARFRVAAPTVVPARRDRVAGVSVPRELSCGLDGARPSPSPTPLPLTPGRNHRLRCLPVGGDPTMVRERTISAEESGPLVNEVRVDPPPADGTGGTGVLVVRLRDAEGEPVTLASLVATASPGLEVGALRETDTRGLYTASVRWLAGARGARLSVRVNDAVTLEQSVGAP
ncbi:MAG: hypothetical protein HY909_00665 [Deltaproteobacteria bacterium]|nr:hypothetical protein [Deltaproteobacteria bacterium]